MSARRAIQTFNMSFLDMMTAALVAMMFLFVISDGSIANNNTKAVVVKANLSFDKKSNQLWGASDSKLKLHDTIMVVVENLDKFPSGTPSSVVSTSIVSTEYNAKVDFHTQIIISKEEYAQLKLKKGIPTDQRLVSKDAVILAANQIAIDKTKFAKLREVGSDETVCKVNKCRDCPASQPTRSCVSCMGLGDITFQIDWIGKDNNLDIYVEKVGIGTVSFKNRSDKRIGIFAPLKDWLGKGVKTSEVVYQEAFIPGTYNIYGSVFKSKQPSVKVRGVVCGRIFPNQSINFESPSIPSNNTKVLIGTVTIGTDGSIKN